MSEVVGIPVKAEELYGGLIGGSQVKPIIELVLYLIERKGLVSNPPIGCHKIYNIWRNPSGNIGYEFESIPES